MLNGAVASFIPTDFIVVSKIEMKESPNTKSGFPPPPPPPEIYEMALKHEGRLEWHVDVALREQIFEGLFKDERGGS